LAVLRSRTEGRRQVAAEGIRESVNVIQDVGHLLGRSLGLGEDGGSPSASLDDHLDGDVVLVQTLVALGNEADRTVETALRVVLAAVAGSVALGSESALHSISVGEEVVPHGGSQTGEAVTAGSAVGGTRSADPGCAQIEASTARGAAVELFAGHTVGGQVAVETGA
jgi:hypothetical protein